MEKMSEDHRRLMTIIEDIQKENINLIQTFSMLVFSLIFMIIGILIFLGYVVFRDRSYRVEVIRYQTRDGQRRILPSIKN